MSTVTVCGNATPRVLENMVFRCLAIVYSDSGREKEVVETADVGQLATGLQSVVGPEVQLRDVFQKAPLCPVVVGERRQEASVGRCIHKDNDLTCSRPVVLVGVQVEREPL